MIKKTSAQFTRVQRSQTLKLRSAKNIRKEVLKISKDFLQSVSFSVITTDKNGKVNIMQSVYLEFELY